MSEGGLRDDGIGDSPSGGQVFGGGIGSGYGDFRNSAGSGPGDVRQSGLRENAVGGSQRGGEASGGGIGGGFVHFRGSAGSTPRDAREDTIFGSSVGNCRSGAGGGEANCRSAMGAVGVEDPCSHAGVALDFLELLDSSSEEEDNLKAVIAVVSHAAYSYHRREERNSRRRRIRYRRSIARSSLVFGTIVTDEEFRGAFRMSRCTFTRLVNILEPHLGGKLPVRNILGRERAGYAIFRLKERLAMCLRLLAGASYHDVAMIFRVSHSARTLLSSHSDGTTARICRSSPSSILTRLRETRALAFSP